MSANCRYKSVEGFHFLCLLLLSWVDSFFSHPLHPPPPTVTFHFFLLLFTLYHWQESRAQKNGISSSDVNVEYWSLVLILEAGWWIFRIGSYIESIMCREWIILNLVDRNKLGWIWICTFVYVIWWVYIGRNEIRRRLREENVGARVENFFVVFWEKRDGYSWFRVVGRDTMKIYWI